MSRDPIGIRGGVNLYGYVGGNPVNRMDPRGEISATNLVVVGLILSAIAVYECFNAISNWRSCCNEIPQPQVNKCDENYLEKFQMWKNRCVNYCYPKAKVASNCLGAAVAY